MPVIVTVTETAGAIALALKISVDAHVGVQPVVENEAITPDGRPEAANITTPGVPDTTFAVTTA